MRAGILRCEAMAQERKRGLAAWTTGYQLGVTKREIPTDFSTRRHEDTKREAIPISSFVPSCLRAFVLKNLCRLLAQWSGARGHTFGNQRRDLVHCRHCGLLALCSLKERPEHPRQFAGIAHDRRMVITDRSEERGRASDHPWGEW